MKTGTAVARASYFNLGESTGTWKGGEAQAVEAFRFSRQVSDVSEECCRNSVLVMVWLARIEN